MGLGFSHRYGPDPDDYSLFDVHWSYSGFMRFRRALAKAEGLNLDDMQGYADYPVGVETAAPGRAIPWSSVSTPLEPLLNHSDCDGELTPDECAQIAPRLKEIVSDWPIDDYDRNAGLGLVAAMEHCAEHGENLEFC